MSSGLSRVREGIPLRLPFLRIRAASLVLSGNLLPLLVRVGVEWRVERETEELPPRLPTRRHHLLRVSNGSDDVRYSAPRPSMLHPLRVVRVCVTCAVE